MKKIIAMLLACVMVLGLFAGCASSGGNKSGDYDYDAIPDTMTSKDGTYQIAFVTDVGQLKDKSFNQGTWEGVKRYAKENDKSYKYYQPANGNQATDTDRFNAMKAAVDAGAEIVVCAGFLQASALEQAATAFTDTKFVFIDGWAMGLDNVMSIDFQEEQSGYLAGYAAVKEGFTKLGFSGGGGGSNHACCRFGYGYVQGIQAAAAELGVTVDVNYSWQYGSSFSASDDLQTMLNGWYANAGTQVVFACGGQMCQSAFAAASANDGYVIGVDVDQSGDSETVITSATKGLREAVMFACDTFYKGNWTSVGGGCSTLGAADDAVGLPTQTWSMEKFSVADYNALYAKLKDGSVVVDRDYENGLKNENFANVNLVQD